MPIETGVTFFKPDSLAIVANKLNSKLKQGRHSNLVCYHRDRIKLKVPICHGRCLEKRGHNTQSIGLRKARMEKQIAAVFEIAEIQAQGTAIRDGGTDRFLLVPPVCQPYVASAPKAYAAIEFVNGFKFNIFPQFLRGHVNFPPRRSGNRRKGLFM
jgi:hypothetical protein